MNILSVGFLLFLAVGLTVYYILPEKYKRIWIFILSAFFLLMHSVYSLVFVVLTAVIIYWIGKRLSRVTGEDRKQIKARKRRIINLGVCTELAILVVIKYGFVVIGFVDGLDGMVDLPAPTFGEGIFLPLGISYYTLQAISYILDVYWGRIPAETSFLSLLNYISFFPHLTQGPISTYGQLSGEINAPHPFRMKNIKFGVQLMLWGLFKMMVVSHRASILVEGVFFTGTVPYGLTVLEGLILFGIQLYCDFSGGIDIIRGVAQCFGIHMIENFRQPFFSTSLSEFWRRWHMSLGEWMKNYVFYPFSMCRAMGSFKKVLKKKVSRKLVNQISVALAYVVVFYLVGIWHGRGSVHAAWGLYNGLILGSGVLLEDFYHSAKKRLNIREDSRSWHAFTLLRTFLIVTVGWVFDCSASAIHAVVHLAHMLQINRTVLIGGKDLVILLLLTGVVLAVDILHEKKISIREVMDRQNYWVQVLFWVVLIQAIACLGRVVIVGGAGGFMYANF